MRGSPPLPHEATRTRGSLSSPDIPDPGPPVHLLQRRRCNSALGARRARRTSSLFTPLATIAASTRSPPASASPRRLGSSAPSPSDRTYPSAPAENDTHHPLGDNMEAREKPTNAGGFTRRSPRPPARRLGIRIPQPCRVEPPRGRGGADQVTPLSRRGPQIGRPADLSGEPACRSPQSWSHRQEQDKRSACRSIALAYPGSGQWIDLFINLHALTRRESAEMHPSERPAWRLVVVTQGG